MTLNELSELVFERAIKKKVIRNGSITKIKKSDKQGFVIKGGKETKQTSAEKIKLSKIQKQAAKQRKSSTASSKISRKTSMRKRTW